MNEKETAEELRKKASELLLLADKINPKQEDIGKTPEAVGNAPTLPVRKNPDWLDEQVKVKAELDKSRQLKGR